jgi:hypothetical protein
MTRNFQKEKRRKDMRKYLLATLVISIFMVAVPISTAKAGVY